MSVKLTPKQRAYAEDAYIKLKLAGADATAAYVKDCVLDWRYLDVEGGSTPTQDIRTVKEFLRNAGFKT